MITDWLTKEYTITELSNGYGVSRKTIYKWIDRYHGKGLAGLLELSREPDHHPNATTAEKVEAILALKRQKMKWGPRKILAKLKNDCPEIKWPADSTGNNILKKYGLVLPRKHSHRTPPYSAPFVNCSHANAVWSADYKGHFRMGNQQKCYPLTISDNYSRYLLGCWGLSRPNLEQTRPCFEAVFLRNGLPSAIRTDNGQPFASRSIGGLSRLSVWFIKLGIIPERIELGCPEQNGRHERMHRTLKESTAKPPRKAMEEQQRSFNDFIPTPKYPTACGGVTLLSEGRGKNPARAGGVLVWEFIEEYNNERPHEALGQKYPSALYRPSSRPYPAKLPKVEYDAGTVVRYVTNRGCIKWKGLLIFVSEALTGEYIALKQIDDHLWNIRFSFYPLGFLDEKAGKVIK